MVKNLKNKVTLRIKQTCSLIYFALAMVAPLWATSSIDSQSLVQSGSSNPQITNPFAEFSAEFVAFRYGKELGHATLALTKLEDNQYRLNYNSTLSIFFLSDKRKEISFFNVENNQIIPQSYVFKRTGTGSDKQLRIAFNHDKQKIVINDRPSFPLEDQLDNQIYRLDLQAKLAAGKTDFNYAVINYRGELKHYHLRVVKDEALTLPFGEVETIKVALIRENSTRQTFAWFAPKLNYQMVRLQQFKDGEEQGDIQLIKFIPINTDI